MEILFLIVILLFSIVIHEIAHGAMANHLGDPTAKYAGRLTLNPISHLSFFGSLLLPGMLLLMGFPPFGYAKPVPINPYNFRDQKYGSAKVAIAGPGANFLLAMIIGFFSRFLPLEEGIRASIINAFFLERDPEALSYLLQGDPFAQIFLIFSFIIFINILLAIFNLLPVPPLDGSHILFAFLPYSMENLKIILSQYGFLILIGFILFLIGFILLGGLDLLFSLVLRLFSLIIGT